MQTRFDAALRPTRSRPNLLRRQHDLLPLYRQTVTTNQVHINRCFRFFVPIFFTETNTGNQNRSSHLRKLPDSPPNLHTFNELKPNELRSAAELIADGSIREHIVRKLAVDDRRRQHDARVATAKAAWAVHRPELSVHACFVGVVAEIGAAAIHADNLNEIMLTCAMPTRNDDDAKRLASALANSTEALAGNESE
jgi:hypothetical protein